MLSRRITAVQIQPTFGQNSGVKENLAPVFPSKVINVSYLDNPKSVFAYRANIDFLLI
jgi:hypothetical protein